MRRHKVHTCVELDYDNNFVIVYNPHDEKDKRICRTPKDEEDAFKAFGIDTDSWHPDSFCEWAYFWHDRGA